MTGLAPGEEYTLPLRHPRRRVARGPLPHRVPGRLARAAADRVLLLPGVRRRLLPRARGPGQAGRRPRRVPRRLRLREGVRRRDPLRHDRARRRDADARRVPRQVLALPHRRAPARGPAAVPAGGDLGRPRGRGQLRRRRARAAPPRTGACRSRERRGNGYRAFFEHMPRRLRSRLPHLRPDPARQRRAVPARHAPVPRRPAVQPDRRARPRRPCPAPITDDPSRPLLGAAAEGVAEARAERVAGALEARRQPGDDHVARRRAAQPAQHRLVGRLRRRPARGRRRAAAGRRVRDRRHPHVLHRPRDRERARAGPDRCAPSSSSPAPSPRRGSPTARPRARPSGSPRPRRSTPPCSPTTRRSSTPTRPTRATRWSRPGAICASTTGPCATPASRPRTCSRCGSSASSRDAPP